MGSKDRWVVNGENPIEGGLVHGGGLNYFQEKAINKVLLKNYEEVLRLFSKTSIIGSIIFLG